MSDGSIIVYSHLDGFDSQLQFVSVFLILIQCLQSNYTNLGNYDDRCPTYETQFHEHIRSMRYQFTFARTNSILIYFHCGNIRGGKEGGLQATPFPRDSHITHENIGCSRMKYCGEDPFDGSATIPS